MTLRRLASLLAAVLCLAPVAACSLTSIGPQTSCKDFLKAGTQERNDAVMRIASETRNSNVTSPLVRPSVEFNCASSPDRKLGDVIESVR